MGKLVILALLALSSSAASFPEYPVRPAHEYPRAVESSGLVVAAVPVEDHQEQITYFGMDLRSKGYIPVLLVVDNSSSSDSFLLDTERLRYSAGSQPSHMTVDPARPARGEKATAVVAATPTVFSFMAAAALSKSKALRQRILGMELESSTLSPGVSVHGFIFIPARGYYSSRPMILLTIPFGVAGSDKVITIDYKL